jgi:hypothetical protein
VQWWKELPTPRAQLQRRAGEAAEPLSACSFPEPLRNLISQILRLGHGFLEHPQTQQMDLVSSKGCTARLCTSWQLSQ